MDMRHAFLLLTLLVTGAMAQAAAETTMPDNLPPTFPRHAIDHVVTYAAWLDWGQKGGDQVVRYRHGALVRTETRHIGSKRPGENERQTDFSNLDTVAALSVERAGDGSLLSVGIWRGRDDIPFDRHALAATGAAERIAGERCAVWQATPEAADGVPYTACITRDGVVLRETVLSRDGKVMDEKRAIKVERRRVRPAEVLPPVEALDWSIWSAPTTASASAADGGGNYELTLAGRKDGAATTKILRAAAGWTAEEDRTDAGLRSLLIIGPAVTLSYYQGDHAIFSVNRNKKSFLSDARDFRSAPIGKPPEIVIGEPCTWFDAAVGVADYGREECRTRDGLPLIRNEYGRGGEGAHWVATALVRGRTSPDATRPPAALMNWTFWGWPELDAGARR